MTIRIDYDSFVRKIEVQYNLQDKPFPNTNTMEEYKNHIHSEINLAWESRFKPCVCSAAASKYLTLMYFFGMVKPDSIQISGKDCEVFTIRHLENEIDVLDMSDTFLYWSVSNKQWNDEAMVKFGETVAGYIDPTMTVNINDLLTRFKLDYNADKKL